MLNIQTFFVFFAVSHYPQHCLAKEQLWGVRVLTGDDPHASTENPVVLRLYGEPGGWSQPIILINRARKTFQRSQIDYFYYFFEDVGTLTSISISVGNRKDNWQLKRIELEKLDSHTVVRTIGIETIGQRPERVRTFYVFNSTTWLDKDGYQRFNAPLITTDRSYLLRVKTMDVDKADTTNSVNVMFYNKTVGKKGVKGSWFEIKPYNGRAVLKRGTTVTFQYITKHIGIPTAVLVEFKEQTHYSDDWYALGGIELEDIGSDGKRTIYTFDGHLYLSIRNLGYNYIIRGTIKTVKTYRIGVLTDVDRWAGTDKRVWIKFEGERPKETGYIQLDTPSHDDFKRGASDAYVLTIEDVGPLVAIRLKTEPGDSWQLGRVYIDEQWQQGWVTRYKIPCNCWVHPDKGVRLLATPYTK